MKKIIINTTPFYSIAETEIEITKYNGQWQSTHSYENHSQSGGFAGCGTSTTKETLRHLKNYRKDIMDRRGKLNDLEIEIIETIKQLESDL